MEAVEEAAEAAEAWAPARCRTESQESQEALWLCKWNLGNHAPMSFGNPDR